VFGSLLVGFARPQAMGTEFRELATTMVDYAAQALERARLYEAETEARREAENANALRVQFTGMISHELRTPLSSVKGFISTLLADDVEWSAEEIRRFLTIADLEADKLNVLVEQLLDLTRFQAGSLEIYPAHHTLREVIRVAEAQLTTLTREHHLVIHLADKLPPVNIDIQRIAQVIVNLVGNAAKFSPPNTTICLTVEAVEGEVRVEVSDDGIGIPEEAREYIFEAFRQIDGTARRGNKGAGLGLAICKALVELHGGKIWVEESGGGGTTMVFTLPARP
jgi:signal transduction histidine kinase